MNWSFARRPKWIVGHLIIISMSVLMIRLAVWQFDRLDERKIEVAQLKTELAGPAALVTSSADFDRIGLNRKIEVRGTVTQEPWVYVRNVLLDGVKGFHQLVPVRLADGSVLVVNAGFLDQEQGNDDFRASVDPPRPVSVIGLSRKPQTTKQAPNPSQFGGTGDVATVAAVDVAQLGTLTEGPVANGWVQQLEPTGTGQRLLPPPDVSEGPHLGYALQWVSFTLIITVGYGLLVYKVARDQAVGGTKRS